MSKNGKRAEYLEACEGFGFDEEAGAGLDLTTATCKACVSNNPQMYDACRKEVEDAKTAQATPATTATTAEKASDTASKAETADKPVVDTPKAKKASKKAPKPKKEKVAKAPKPPKADRGPSVMQVLVELIREGGRTTKELTVELTKRTGCTPATAGTHVSHGLRFGILFGSIQRDADKKIGVVE